MDALARQIDWRVLIGVRERRRDAARDTLQRTQRESEARARDVSRAQAAWHAQVAAQVAHTASTRDGAAGGVSVAQLRQAGAWHGALGERIAEGARQLARAQARERDQLQVQLRARRALLQADAELDQARQMQQRDQRERLRVRERRMDDVLDEAGTQAWANAADEVSGAQGVSA